MLKGLSPLLSADLLYVLASMGHGDEIVLADANFPAATHASELIRLPGVSVARVLDAVLSVMPLDTFVATGETRVYGNVILRKGVVLQGGDE